MTDIDRLSQPQQRRPHLVSVVLPVYNEEQILEDLVHRITDEIEALGAAAEIILVDDGSTDRSAAILDRLAAASTALKVIHFSRNFGPQAAVQSGLSCAHGDAVIVMDADMQDDPAAIPRFLEEWGKGHDVVYAIRTDRKEFWLKRALFSLFYALLQRISYVPIPLNAGNFGLIDRRVCRLIGRLDERDRYYPGLRAWIGFGQKGIPIERRARYDATPRVHLGGLFRLAKTAVFSFSFFPMAFFHFVAIASLTLCAGLSCFTLYHKLFTGLAIPGWTSYLIAVSFFGALNALGISVLGEYVLRIHDQVRQRPSFIVRSTVNLDRRPAVAGTGFWPEDSPGSPADQIAGPPTQSPP